MALPGSSGPPCYGLGGARGQERKPHEIQRQASYELRKMMEQSSLDGLTGYATNQAQPQKPTPNKVLLLCK